MCRCESWVCIGRVCFEASFELILLLSHLNQLKESKEEVGNYTLTYSQYRSWSQSLHATSSPQNTADKVTNNPPILPVTIFYSDLLFFFSFALETGLSACSLFQINTFLSNQKWCCYFTCTMSLFPASVLLSVIFSSCEERRNNPDTADLWLSCTPLRLVMVSSRFCRRSRTFCTVLFLWDSGSAGGTHTWVILTTKNCHAAT